MTARADSRLSGRRLVAYTLPMIVFLLLLGLTGALKKPDGSLWQRAPEFWIYPLQTLLCAALLIYFRRDYNLPRLQRLGFAIAVGLLVFVLWIAPQQLLGFAPRVVGFNPAKLAAEPVLYWAGVTMRFLRLVVVVPLVEEIFWRGFLLRYLIAEDFESTPFGSFTWLSFVVVTISFAFSHSKPDWPAALITGALYNFVAYRTRNLPACILTHSLTNLALGCWIMATHQWGFW